MFGHPTRADQTRLHGLEGLRAIAALSVVVYHAGVVMGSERYFAEASFAQATNGLDAGVDLFFVLSGFVIALPIFLAGGARRSTSRFLADRAFRLYPLTILTVLLVAAGQMALGETGPDFVPTMVTSALLVPAPYAPDPLVLWTLKQEVLFYAFFSVCFIHRRAGFMVVALWLTAVAVQHVALPLLGGRPMGGWLADTVLHVKNLEFGIGIVACRLACGRTGRLAQTDGFTMPFLLAAGGFFAAAWWTGATEYARTFDTAVLGLSAGLAVYFGALSTVRIGPMLMILAKASFAIYLIHLTAILALNKVMYTPDPAAPVALYFAFYCGMSVAVGLVFYWLVDRPLLNARRKIRGALAHSCSWRVRRSAHALECENGRRENGVPRACSWQLAEA